MLTGGTDKTPDQSAGRGSTNADTRRHSRSSVRDAGPTKRANLVAHHLNVMDRAGMITRHRSEADRRRSYVSLASDAFHGLLPGPVPTPRRVVFVCTANSARSQMAAALWPRFSSVPAVSAGTHPGPRIEPGAIDTVQAHGLHLADSSPRALSSVRAGDDFVITVCDTAREELADAADAHWSIPDPVPTGTPVAFEAAFDDLTRRITGIAPRFAA